MKHAHNVEVAGSNPARPTIIKSKMNISELAKGNKSSFMENFLYRKENKYWLYKSTAISLLILDRLDELNWSKEDLGKKLDVSIDIVTKYVSGKENFTLSQICQLENVLSIKLLVDNEESTNI